MQARGKWWDDLSIKSPRRNGRQIYQLASKTQVAPLVPGSHLQSPSKPARIATCEYLFGARGEGVDRSLARVGYQPFTALTATCFIAPFPAQVFHGRETMVHDV